MTRAEIIASIEAFIEDNNARSISPADVRNRMLEIVNNAFNLEDDNFRLKLKHSPTTPYVIDDIVYHSGNFYIATSDSQGAFNGADWSQISMDLVWGAMTGTITDQADLVLYIATQIAAVVDSSPAALNTLNELAAALGDDANFASTMTTALSGKLSKTTDKASDGEVQTGTNDTKWFSSLSLAAWWTWIKTQTAIISGIWTFSESPIVPTPTTDTQAANKEYVDSAIDAVVVIPTIKHVAAQLPTTSNVDIDIPELVFALGANSKYAVIGFYLVGCNNTGGVKFGCDIPADATMMISYHGNTTNAGTHLLSFNNSDDVLTTGAFNQANTQLGQIRVIGTIETVTAGNAQFTFASNTNLQESTIHTKSWIKLIPLS